MRVPTRDKLKIEVDHFANNKVVYYNFHNLKKNNNNNMYRIRGSFKNHFLKSVKPHDLGSILNTSYFYSFTLGGLYIIF